MFLFSVLSWYGNDSKAKGNKTFTRFKNSKLKKKIVRCFQSFACGLATLQRFRKNRR